jgi:tRNA A37 threonylcarbamoyladenosine dehydratase
MKKRVPALVLALALALTVPAWAAQDTPDNFVRSKTYAGQFSDLTPESTFYDNVAALYAYGLSVGKADGTFGLRDQLTVGQVVIFAGRIRSLYRTGDAEAGPGAYAAEMIVRAGVGRMTVADADTVNPTNINRQLVALHSTVGRPKAEVLAERLRDINPALELHVVDKYIKDEETDLLLDSARFDYAVDAIDTLSPKLALILGALKRGIPLVSSMGAGAKTDPTRLEIEDISRTHHCPLAHMLRKRLHKAGIRSGFKAVFSAEPVREGATILCEEQNKKSNTGTISYLPALFGIGCASVVVRGVIGEL